MSLYPKYYTKEILAKVLPKYCHGKTIDVGSGSAKYRELITKFSSKYITVDNLSSKYQFSGSESCKPDVIADIMDLPFSKDEFDTVICTEVLEHVSDPFLLFKELSRVLKPSGYLLLSSGWMAPYHKEPEDYWRFSPAAYRLLCEKNNLEIVEIIKQGGFFSCILYFIRRNIELNGGVRIKKITSFFLKPVIILEKIVEKMDNLVKTEDSIGHLIIAKKL